MSDVITLFRPCVPPPVVNPKALFLVPCFSSCNTTPLSTPISPLSLNHHLYADDTQLFFSFYPPNFDSSIKHLQNALQQISSWMTANLLTLNSFKTEFLLIGLRKQLDKIHNSSPNTTHSARNLGFILDEHTSLIKFRPSPNLAITISDSFVVSVLTFIPTQLAPLPPPSFTPNSITVILSTTTYKSQITRLQQIQNSLARVVVKTPKCCHITPILYTLFIGSK